MIVAVWIQAVAEFRIVANIMKFMSEIGKIVDVGRHFFRLPSDFLQLGRPVKGHFRLSSFHLEACVPSSSSRPVESTSGRVCMCKGSINYMREAEAGNQFNGGNPRQPPALAEQPVVCGAFELR